MHRYAITLLADFKPNEQPLTPGGGAASSASSPRADPSRVCVEPPPFPLAGLLSEPIKIVQAPRMTIVLYEAGNMFRQIFADGRVLPKEVNFPAFLGYSTGRWERDVFVVETAGFNDKVPLDIIGHPHSEDLRITERFRRIDFGHMDMEVTLTDPKMYTKPITIKVAAHAAWPMPTSSNRSAKTNATASTSKTRSRAERRSERGGCRRCATGFVPACASCLSASTPAFARR